MNKKIAVIYKSKYGSTKRYAGWIAIKLDADLYEINDIKAKDLVNYHTIVFGGGIYLGKINGLNFISKYYDKIKDKKIIIFAIGLESKQEDFKELLNKSLDEKLINDLDIEIYKYRGRFNYSELNFIDKVLIKGLISTINKKNVRDLTEDDKIILEGFKREVDLCDKKSIENLISTLENDKASS